MGEILSGLVALAFTVLIFVAIFRYVGFGIQDRTKVGGFGLVSIPISVAWFLLRHLWAAVKWLWKSQEKIGGDARFMESGERRKLLASRHKGFVLDGVGKERLSAEDSFRNVAVVATTGAGKTAGFILPNVMKIDGASMVIADPSGALFAKTSADLVRRGYDVRVINPSDPSNSDLYNPLERAKTHTEMAEIAHILVRTGSAGGTGDRFWTDGAEEIVSALIRTLKNHPDRSCHNLANLHFLLNSFGNGSGLNDFVADFADEATYHVFKGFVSQSQNTMQGHLSTAKTALRMLSDPDVARLTAKQTFEFSDLRKRKTALFLIFPQNRVSYYAFLMNLLYTQLFHFCLDDKAMGPSSLPIYFLLDEFGHATVPDFPAIVTTTRQRKIGISIVLQSVSQLEERYGKAGAQTILSGGIASRLFFSGMDIGTAEMLEKTLGTRRHEVRDSEDRLYLRDDSLLSAPGLRTMPDNQVLYLFANKPPAVLKITPYYLQPDLVRRTKRPPIDVRVQAEERIRYVDIE